MPYEASVTLCAMQAQFLKKELKNRQVKTYRKELEGGNVSLTYQDSDHELITTLIQQYKLKPL